MNGWRRLPAGPFRVAHTNFSDVRTSGPYTLDLGLRGFVDAGLSASARARRACRRVQSVRAHSSSSILPFSLLPALEYRLAICLVTALRSAIESPTTPLLATRADPGRG